MLSDQFTITTVTALIGALTPVVVATWRLFKYLKKFLAEQDQIKEHLKVIKQEVTPNGGGSMKDIINNLKLAVDRIEVRQKILDQRSKATLHHTTHPLFETDKEGRLTWYNEALRDQTIDNGSLEGHDWFSIVDEDHRESFINEIKSCLRMCRKIDIETMSVNGCTIRFVGFPYKVGNSIHEGFLIHLLKVGECHEYRRV